MNKVRKKQGRPALFEEKRVHFIKTRLNDKELQRLVKLEESLGMNRSDLIRSRLLGNSDKVLVSVKELIAALDKIGAELGRSGNNINQLARHANMLNKNGGISSFDWQVFSRDFTEYLSLQKSIEQAIRSLLGLLRS